MSATPYQGQGSGDGATVPTDEAPLSHNSVPVEAASSPTPSSTSRRKRTPSSPSKTLSLMAEIQINDERNTSAVGDASGDGSSQSLFLAAERRPRIREMICNYIFGKSKPLIFGQLLSLMLAGTGAIQSSLYLDCHLSAPTFSMLSFYLPLCIFSLSRHVWLLRRKEQDRESFFRQLTSSKSSEQDGYENDGSGDETSNSQHATQQSNERNLEIQAKPEKRNHLLSRWSQFPQPAEANEDGGLSIDCGNALGSSDVDNTTFSPDKKSYSLLGLIPLKGPLRKYAAIAVFDVYANYVTIMAFKYTTITNVSLFDALSIPSAILVSRLFFGRKYTMVHILAVMVCGVGIMLNVLQDYREEKHLEEAGNGEESAQEQMIEDTYPYKLWGDLLAITGGILFGISNTLQEVTVKDVMVTEYLGCMTFFASIISFIQVLILERGEVTAFFSQSSSETCSESMGLILFFAFSIGGSMQYLGISGFLQISDAAFLNLSLLTGDAWSVAFSVFGEGIVPPPSFYVALIITVSGVFIYEMAPSPVEDSTKKSGGEIQVTETSSSTGVEVSENEQEGVLA